MRPRELDLENIVILLIQPLLDQKSGFPLSPTTRIGRLSRYIPRVLVPLHHHKLTNSGGQNDDVVSIQDFIGSLQGYNDIPGLFQEILDGGLYSPQFLHLGPKPVLPGQKEPSVINFTLITRIVILNQC